MLKGYIETERMPAKIASLISLYSDAGAEAWLGEALAASSAAPLRMIRALSEVVLLLVGEDASLAGRSAPGAAAAPPVPGVLGLLASAGSPVALRVLADAACARPHLLAGPILATVARNASGVLDASVLARAVDPAYLLACRELVSALSAAALPAEAPFPLLVDLTLKLIYLLRTGPGAEGGPVLNDAVLARFVQGIPRGALPLHLLASIGAVGSGRVRSALALLAPEMCLADPDPAIRALAVKTLSDSPASAGDPAVAQRVLYVCLRAPFEQELPSLSSAAPTLVAIAAHHPPHAHMCAALVFRAMALATRSSGAGVPPPALVACADSLVASIGPASAAAFAAAVLSGDVSLDKERASFADLMREHCPRWADALREVAGAVVRAPNREAVPLLAVDPRDSMDAVWIELRERE